MMILTATISGNGGVLCNLRHQWMIMEGLFYLFESDRKLVILNYDGQRLFESDSSLLDHHFQATCSHNEHEKQQNQKKGQGREVARDGEGPSDKMQNVMCVCNRSE